MNEENRAAAAERDECPQVLWSYVRVSIVCPRCVRTIAQYLVPKGVPMEFGPVVCPWCDEGKRDE